MRRRSVLMGLATIGAAPRAVAQPEDPNAAMHRLMRELAEVMPYAMNGQFRAIINPDGQCWLQATYLPIPDPTT
jgi:hypothetical protein